MFQVDPPFALGDTYAGTRNGALVNSEIEGRDFVFPLTEVVANALGMRDRTSGRTITVRVMRNISGGALLGKRLVRATPSSLDACTKVTGYQAVEGQKYVFPSDPLLPAAGVADDDLFYVIIKGPTTLLTPASTDDIDGPLSAGDEVMGSASTNGRVIKAVEFNDISSAYSGLRHSIGTSLTDAGPNETSKEIVVDICLPWA